MDESEKKKSNLVILWRLYCLHVLFQGQADLLQHTKAEVQENMKQIHDAALTGNLTKESVGVRRVHSLTRKGQDPSQSGQTTPKWKKTQQIARAAPIARCCSRVVAGAEERLQKGPQSSEGQDWERWM